MFPVRVRRWVPVIPNVVLVGYGDRTARSGYIISAAALDVPVVRFPETTPKVNGYFVDVVICSGL